MILLVADDINFFSTIYRVNWTKCKLPKKRYRNLPAEGLGVSPRFLIPPRLGDTRGLIMSFFNTP
jgi:hypothetical protein